MRRCNVNGCDKKHYGKGYCQRHAWQFRTHGRILDHTRYDDNTYRVDGDVTYLDLRNKQHEIIGEAIIDADRLDECLKHKWSLQNFGYVNARIDGKLTLMHRFLFGIPSDGLDTDHINRIRHDNRECNIRHVTRSVNVLNSPVRAASGIRNVYYNKRRQKWFAAIHVDGMQKYLGSSNTKEGAAELMALP